MTIEDFVFDASSGVYICSTEIKQINYLDGSERYLYEVLMSTHALGLLSNELRSKIKDWQVYII